MKGAELYGQVRRAEYVEGASPASGRTTIWIDPRTALKMLIPGAAGICIDANGKKDQRPYFGFFGYDARLKKIAAGFTPLPTANPALSYRIVHHRRLR